VLVVLPSEFRYFLDILGEELRKGKKVGDGFITHSYGADPQEELWVLHS